MNDVKECVELAIAYCVAHPSRKHEWAENYLRSALRGNLERTAIASALWHLQDWTEEIGQKIYNVLDAYSTLEERKREFLEKYRV